MKKVSAQKKSEDWEWQGLLENWRNAGNQHGAFQVGAAYYEPIGQVANLYDKITDMGVDLSAWSDWLRAHGIKPHPRKPFRGLIGALTKGHLSPSWVTKISSGLDEWREVLVHEYAECANGEWLAEFLDGAGGVTGIYQDRLKRLGTTKARKRRTIDERIASLLQDRGELVRQRDEYKERAEAAESDCEDLQEQLELERQKRIAA